MIASSSLELLGVLAPEILALESLEGPMGIPVIGTIRSLGGVLVWWVRGHLLGGRMAVLTLPGTGSGLGFSLRFHAGEVRGCGLRCRWLPRACCAV